MTHNDMLLIVRDFLIGRNLHQFGRVAQFLIYTFGVVISQYKNFTAVESSHNLYIFYGIWLTPNPIPQNIYSVGIGDGIIPSFNKGAIHFFHRAERTVIELDYIGMANQNEYLRCRNYSFYSISPLSIQMAHFALPVLSGAEWLPREPSSLPCAVRLPP